MRANRQYNHFSIVEHLGTGGMGAVYKALDRNLNRMVALKLLRKELSADENYIIKLEDEARITASINHPFVVKVFLLRQRPRPVLHRHGTGRQGHASTT